MVRSVLGYIEQRADENALAFTVNLIWLEVHWINQLNKLELVGYALKVCISVYEGSLGVNLYGTD